MDKYFLDTEFIDTGSTIDLISIGIVCSDGREYYAQSIDFNGLEASDWVKENVLPHLSLCSHLRQDGIDILERLRSQQSSHGFFGGQCHKPYLAGKEEDCYWRTQRDLRDEVKAFFNPSDGFELYGWCAGYDFVALCQLFGTMMDLPIGFPHYIRDVQYLLDEAGISDEALYTEVPQQGTAHNALDDARYIRDIWKTVHPYAHAPKWAVRGSVSIQGSVAGSMIITGDNNALRGEHGR